MVMKRREFILGTMALPLCWSPARAYQIPTQTLVAKTEEGLMRVRGAQVALVGERRDPAQASVSPLGSRWIFTTPPQIDVNGIDGKRARVRLAPDPMGLGVSPGAPGQVEGNTPQILPPTFMRLVLDSVFRLGRIEPLVPALRIDLSARRLALFEERVVQVLGSATPRDRRSGQIWIDQSTFHVARVMGKWGGTTYDLRLQQWHGPTTGGQFPHRLLLLTEGRWIRRLETDAVQAAAAR